MPPRRALCRTNQYPSTASLLIKPTTQEIRILQRSNRLFEQARALCCLSHRAKLDGRGSGPAAVNRTLAGPSAFRECAHDKEEALGGCPELDNSAGATGFEPAISGLTGRHVKPLHYAPSVLDDTTEGPKRQAKPTSGCAPFCQSYNRGHSEYLSIPRVADWKLPGGIARDRRGARGVAVSPSGRRSAGT